MTEAAVTTATVPRYYFGSDDPDDQGGAAGAPFGRAPMGRELDYKVELWDATRTSVEQVLAVTAHGSIGYAAYFAAIKEYPDRHIVLRHKGGILSRSSGSGH
jgi:hypothetical protein